MRVAAVLAVSARTLHARPRALRNAAAPDAAAPRLGAGREGEACPGRARANAGGGVVLQLQAVALRALRDAAVRGADAVALEAEPVGRAGRGGEGP